MRTQAISYQIITSKGLIQTLIEESVGPPLNQIRAHERHFNYGTRVSFGDLGDFTSRERRHLAPAWLVSAVWLTDLLKDFVRRCTDALMLVAEIFSCVGCLDDSCNKKILPVCLGKLGSRGSENHLGNTNTVSHLMTFSCLGYDAQQSVRERLSRKDCHQATRKVQP